MYDVVLLTDARYLVPKADNNYISNVILEDQLVAKALQEKGLSVVRKAWDDAQFDWKSAKFALFRATWDYFDRFDEFFRWLNRTKEMTRFINSAPLITWNIDKHYLEELHSKKINIPKTFFVEKGSRLSLREGIQKAQEQHLFNTVDVVLKPCIAGAARNTFKINRNQIEDFEWCFQNLVAKEAMMLQEFQANIVSEGELSLIFFQGKFSHAVLKRAKAGDFRVQDDYGGSVHVYHPSKTEIDFANTVVHACPELPVYARVDIFRDNEGNWALAELEIFEPELWFRNKPEAAHELATIISNKIDYEKVL
ncbi:MAG: hypothetical protein AAF575_05615 [Bacteroidota bacterium]